MTENTHADLLVLGFGKAGKTIAMKAAAAGQKVVLVEQSAQMYGGTCINIGCVPTKTLLHSADMHRAAEASLPDEEAYAQAMGRKRTLREKMNAANLAMVTSPGVLVMTGRARFTGPKTVEVAAGEETLTVTADKVVINTGATPRVPSIPGLGDDPLSHPLVMTSTELIDTDALPRRIALLGGGFISLELANMYAEFGSEVTVINRESRLMPGEDPDTAAAVEDVLAETGVRFLHGVEIRSAASGEEDSAPVLQIELQKRDGDDVESLTVDALVVSVGRVPATEGLGAEKAGVELAEGGAVTVDEHLRTTAEGVWAAGDVTGGPQFTYVSFDDVRIILPQILTGAEGKRTTENRGPIPSTTFVTPPFARVGLTAAQAHEKAAEEGWEVTVFRKNIADIAVMPRPKAVGDPRGFMQVVVDSASETILGATLFCVDAQEIINLVTMAMKHGLPYTALRDAVYTHPSSTEGLNGLLAQ